MLNLPDLYNFIQLSVTDGDYLLYFAYQHLNIYWIKPRPENTKKKAEGKMQWRKHVKKWKLWVEKKNKKHGSEVRKALTYLT